MDKASSTCSPRDEIDDRTLPGFLPGAAGAVVHAAIDALAASDKDTRLVIDKRRSPKDGKFYVTVDMKPLDDSK